MNGYRFDVECPRCGTALQHITASRPAPLAALQTSAVARCHPCRDDFHIEVRMTSLKTIAARRAVADDHLDHLIAQVTGAPCG